MKSNIFYSVTRILSDIGFAGAVFLNLFLLLITVYKVKKIDFGYKLLLLSFSVLCLLFAVLLFFLDPFYHSHNAGIIAFNLANWEVIPKTAGRVIVAAFTGLYVSIVSFFSILFTFRFWTMTNHPWGIRFRGWKSLRLIPYSISVGILCTFVVFHFGEIDRMGQDYFRETLMQNYNVSVKDVSGWAIIAYEPIANVSLWKRLNGNSYVVLHTIVSILTFQYIVVGYCALRIHFNMKSMIESFSPSSRKLQTKFYKCLMLQITPPTVIFYIPTLNMLTIPYFNFSLDFPTGIVVILFSWYPVADSCILILIISEFRVVLKRLLKAIVTWCRTGGEPDGARNIEIPLRDLGVIA